MATQISDQELKSLLEKHRRIAVIGLSPEPSRPSYGVTRYMINHGYETYGVRPGSPAEILGRPSYSSLDELKEPVDIINVFRASDAIPEVVNQIEAWMKSKPSAQPALLWLQEGITNPEAEEKARSMGLKVVSDRCILKEHRRLLG